MSQPIIGRGGNLYFFFHQAKNTNLVEDVEIRLPVMFRRIPRYESRLHAKGGNPKLARGFWAQGQGGDQGKSPSAGPRL